VIAAPLTSDDVRRRRRRDLSVSACESTAFSRVAEHDASTQGAHLIRPGIDLTNYFGNMLAPFELLNGQLELHSWSPGDVATKIGSPSSEYGAVMLQLLSGFPPRSDDSGRTLAGRRVSLLDGQCCPRGAGGGVESALIWCCSAARCECMRARVCPPMSTCTADLACWQALPPHSRTSRCTPWTMRVHCWI
jgi:hypothetical protein